jgi:hypothetical protein
VLQQLLKNINIRNNVVHRDVLDAMFRQVKSNEALAFKQHTIDAGTFVLPAVEFDLGKQGQAYYDKDTASYQYTPGVHTQGNRGHAFRNDGVDITGNDSGTSIFSIEDGEWLQYTVQVKKAGNFQIGFNATVDNAGAQLSLLANDRILIDKLTLPAPDSKQNYKTTWVKNVSLPAGTTRLKLLANKGGFTLQSISFIKE